MSIFKEFMNSMGPFLFSLFGCGVWAYGCECEWYQIAMSYVPVNVNE